MIESRRRQFFHWRRRISVQKDREIFTHLLNVAKDIEWRGLSLKKVSDLGGVSEKFGMDMAYCYRKFVECHHLLVFTGEPGEFFIFEDRKEAEKFMESLVIGQTQTALQSKQDDGAEKIKSVLKSGSKSSIAFPEIVGQSMPIRKVADLIRMVAKSMATVLFSGESGTGKELFARAVHALSPRREGPFVAINCAAIPETLIESELFGHEKGAFTDAGALKLGRFELARGGTLFLDEVSDLPLLVQTKVLRFLQEHTFERVGGTETLKADVRIVAATNSDLTKALKEKRFREDLYYRLNVFPITIPPLRGRPKDIPLLVEHFLTKFSAVMSIKVPALAPEVMSMIMVHSWPGNVRELENLIERALIHGQGKETLSLEDFTLGGTVSCFDVGVPNPSSEEKDELLFNLQEVEALTIRKALAWTHGNKAQAAKLLGICPKTLYYKTKEPGLN